MGQEMGNRQQQQAGEGGCPGQAQQPPLQVRAPVPEQEGTKAADRQAIKIVEEREMRESNGEAVRVEVFESHDAPGRRDQQRQAQQGEGPAGI